MQNEYGGILKNKNRNAKQGETQPDDLKKSGY